MMKFLRRLPKVCIYLTLVFVLGLAAVVLGLRYWLLPNIETYRDDIVAAVSKAAGTRVAIGGIRAEWGGLRPRLELDKVQVFDARNNPALELVKVDAIVAWRSIFAGALRLHRLEIIQPSLEIRRDKAGKLFVAGIPMRESEEGGGFNDLVLETRSVFITGAILSWEDELRGRPRLVLDGVSFHLENRGSRHRFGLTGKPPVELAGAIDLRGDLRGESLDDRNGWSGQVYAELPYADSDSWRSHVPLPKSFRGGRGALRLWLDFKGQAVESFVADVKLADVVARLNENLPELDLASVNGRIRYKAIGAGFEVASENLSLVTRGETRTGPTDFLFRTEPKQEKKEAQGEFRTNDLELAAWASLIDYLPVDKGLKSKLAEFAPSGRVKNVAFKWTGQANAPAKYTLAGRIERGAVRSVGGNPGVVGLTAQIDADESGGSVSIDSASQISWPTMLNGPIPFDELKAQATWKRTDGHTDIQLKKVSFANPHTAGSISGSYRAIPGKRGVIDLNVKFDRGQGRYAALYLPRPAGPVVYEWLQHAILNADISEGNLRLVGDLTHFPFADNKDGEFLLHFKFSEGVLNYADAWPRIENIRGDVTLQGAGLKVKASDGAIFGAKLNDVVASVEDLYHHNPVVEVIGESSGPFKEKLRFINESPVKDMLGGFTDGVTGSGAGKLNLSVSIPVLNVESTRMNGSYQFQRAGLQLSGAAPPVSEINGQLKFTEAGVAAQNIAAQILGGPALVSVATRPDKSIAVTAKGSANMEELHKLASHSALKSIYGKADWQGAMEMREGKSVLKVTSALHGIASDLPPPLRKTYAQERPLKYEHHWNDGKPELIRASLGDDVFAEFERVHSPGAAGAIFKRGVVSFGAPAALPVSDGLWLSGALRALNLDRWREVFKAQGSGNGSGGLAIAGVDLALGSLRAFDRRFTDLHFIARVEGSDWLGTVAGQELAGDFAWRPAGKGLFHARLKRLTLPEERPAPGGQAETIGGEEVDFPALDIIADALQIRNKRLGRLELKAEQQGKDWRIERLALSQAGATLEGHGLWLRQGANPSTTLNIELKAPDAGKLLDELGFPGSLKGGAANLSGALSWPGAPYEMIPAKLSGNLELETKSGQFLKIEPGAGRLLGLMSLQSLPRRITLDFRDIFSEGFAFDGIKGEMGISEGLLSSKNFTISGPSARVEMVGDVNLGKETQQLRVKVMPTVGEGVSIATGLLGGPVIGVTAYVLQKVFKDPISRAIAYEYNVTGTWDNPNVSKLERKAPVPVNDIDQRQ